MQRRLLKAVLCVLALTAIIGPARAEICQKPQIADPGSPEPIAGQQAQTSDQGSGDVGTQHFCPGDPPPFDPPPPPEPEPVVKGYIDGIVTDGAGTPHVRGWACATTLSQSIDVHLYVGDASGTGTYLGAHTASVSSGTGVANACDAGGEHRFYITLTDAQRLAHAGETIYIHGISPVGGSHNLLTQSGQFAVPAMPNDPPSVALTAPTDGSQKVAPAHFGLTATASDSDGIASVEFYAGGNFLIRDFTAPYAYRGWADIGVGTYQVQARARDNRGATKSSAVRTVTVVAPNVLPSVSLTAPANGASDEAPGSFTVSADASDPDGDGIVNVQFKADGDVIHTDTTAPYSYTWSNVASDSYTLQAVATDGRDGVTASAPRTVTVIEPPNVLPNVSLTEPVDGANDYVPGGFTLSASAIDPDADGIVSVAFTVDGAIIHTDTTRPYSYVWSNVEIGSYTLRALATDGRDGVAISTTRTVTVTERPNVPPSVSLTAPDNGASDEAPGSFTLAADAIDPDGDGIVDVQFKANGVVIYTDNTAPYSYTWSNVDSDSYTLQAVATDGRDGVTASVTRTVTVTEPPNDPPSVALTAPADGAQKVAPANFGLTATANDSDGIASVEFYAGGNFLIRDFTAPYAYHGWADIGVGTYQVQARARDNRGATTSSAVRTVTVVAPNVPPSVSLTAPANGASDEAPGSFTLAADASDPDGDGIVDVQFKANGVVIYTDNTAPYSYTWRNVASDSYTLQAVARDGRDGVTASATRSVTVTPPPNIPPNVSLTAPDNGASAYEPGSFTLSAGAIDPDADGIASVAFTVDGAVIYIDTTRPYSYVWSNVEIGEYILRAVATDRRDGVAVSASRTVSVTEPPNIPPDVSLTAPADGVEDYAPGSFTISADASDPDDDGIVDVQFKADGVVIYTDTSAPYSYTWSNVDVGSYTLQAVATDGRNGVTASATRSVSVSEGPNIPPSVSLTSPADGASAYAPGWFTIAADASDSDGDGIASVTFKADGVVIHEDTTTPYSYAWHNVDAGAYTLQAVARDTRDGVTGSATRSVTVAPPPSDGVDSVTRRYVYDDHQRLCKTIEPETGATIVEYDAAGNVAWTASGQPLLLLGDCQRNDVPLAQRVTRQYGARNRVLTVDYPDNRGNTTYTYMPDGLPSTIATNDGTHVVTTSYWYNRRRLMTTEQLAWGSINWQIGYAYNANGQLAAHTYPDGLTVDYAPNALGQPTRAGSFATSVRYHPNGAIKQFTYGNGIVHTLTQNERGLPVRSRDAYFGSAVLDDSYDYDFNGNVAAISDALAGHVGDRTMTYDVRDRLIRVVAPMFGGDNKAVFAYDAVDNLTYARVGDVIKGVSYHYDPNNQLTNVRNAAGATVVGLGYGPRGNVTNKNGKVLDFDYGNRLRGISGVASYVYDGLGRRVADDAAGGAKYSLYSASGQLMYTDDQRNGAISDYIHLGGSLVAIRERDTATQAYATKYQHTDALGSPVAVTDASRGEVDRDRYAPYGAQIGGAPNDGVGYTGHVMDAASGLIYMQQRYYDPLLRRFLSVDPVPVEDDTGDNFNRYWYANNNPYRYYDSDGRCTGSRITNSDGTCKFSGGFTTMSPGPKMAGVDSVVQEAQIQAQARFNPDTAVAVGPEEMSFPTYGAENIRIGPGYPAPQDQWVGSAHNCAMNPQACETPVDQYISAYAWAMPRIAAFAIGGEVLPLARVAFQGKRVQTVMCAMGVSAAYCGGGWKTVSDLDDYITHGRTRTEMRINSEYAGQRKIGNAKQYP